MTDSFKARTHPQSGAQSYEIWSLPALGAEKVARLPYSLKILLENLLRFEDGVNVTRADIEALLNWDPKAAAVVRDLVHAGARDHAGLHRRAGDRRSGGDARGHDAPRRQSPTRSIRWRRPSWSSTTRCRSTATARAHSLADNNRIEFERNGERYAFLRWGQSAFRNFKVVPPNTGIVHQVNLEYLGRVVFENSDAAQRARPIPDTLVGTDSHTTMINGLGVLGWGVGGIEAEAAMLGQPVTMLIPQVIGFKLSGSLHARRHRDRPGADGDRDAAQARRGRQIRRILRRRPGQSAAGRSRHDRQHVARIRQHLRHLSDRRGDAALPAALGSPGRADPAGRGLCARPGPVAHRTVPSPPQYTDVLELDLGSVEPSLAGPSRPQDRVPLRIAKSVYRHAPRAHGRGTQPQESRPPPARRRSASTASRSSCATARC